MTSDNTNDFFGSPIHTYTRAEAMADGFLIDVSEMAREAGFKFPVAVSRSVWSDYIEWADEDTQKQTYQDTEGRLWDVLSMLRFGIAASRGSRSFIYKLNVVPRDGKTKRAKLTRLKAEVHGGDNGEPVITVLLPNED
jgi:hypothetical protein